MNDPSPRSEPSRTSARTRAAGIHVHGTRLETALPVLLALAAFAVYWASAMMLEIRGTASHFGADTGHYAALQYQAVNHRAARFHPATILLGLGWMKLLHPLTAWLAPATWLKALFGAVGAVGVWAATVTFRALLPGGPWLLGGILYASSLGVWYFSAIPESKIVTATLSVLYIAVYVRLRQRWTFSGAAALTAVLMIACFNEIVSAFLVAIPVVDALVRRGIDWRHNRWMIGHVASVFVVWAVLEFVVNGWLIPPATHAEGQSHFKMLLYYIVRNDHGLASLYGFVLNWFLFNIAAPSPFALYWPTQGGYFEPGIAGYFQSFPTIGILVLLGTIAAASTVRLLRSNALGLAAPLLLALAAFAIVRAAFFFMFNPSEPLLFSPAVTLVHWLLLLVPFAASPVPAKRLLLSALAVLMLAVNGRFMLGNATLTDAAYVLFGLKS